MDRDKLIDETLGALIGVLGWQDGASEEQARAVLEAFAANLLAVTEPSLADMATRFFDDWVDDDRMVNRDDGRAATLELVRSAYELGLKAKP